MKSFVINTKNIKKSLIITKRFFSYIYLKEHFSIEEFNYLYIKYIVKEYLESLYQCKTKEIIFVKRYRITQKLYQLIQRKKNQENESDLQSLKRE